MNPAQKCMTWCGMQPGTLTLWYAISLCSPVHDAIQVPRFYKDFCFLQSHKLLIFPVCKKQNGSVFLTIFCILKSYLCYSFFHSKIMVYVQTNLAIQIQFTLYISHSRSLFTLSVYSVVSVNVVWVFGDIEASYNSWSITLKNTKVQNTKIIHVKSYLLWANMIIYLRVHKGLFI